MFHLRGLRYEYCEVEVLTKIAVFLDVMPCCLVDKYQVFEVTCFCLLEVKEKFFRNVGIAYCSALRHISEILDVDYTHDLSHS